MSRITASNGRETALPARFAGKSNPDRSQRGDYDLIVMAADSPHWWQRRILGELIKPLLSWTDLPVLITKPGELMR